MRPFPGRMQETSAKVGRADYLLRGKIRATSSDGLALCLRAPIRAQAAIVTGYIVSSPTQRKPMDRPASIVAARCTAEAGTGSSVSFRTLLNARPLKGLGSSFVLLWQVGLASWVTGIIQGSL